MTMPHRAARSAAAIHAGALLLALAAPGAALAQSTDAPSRVQFWAGLGGGGYLGEEYDKPAGCCTNPGDDQSYEVGGYAFHATFNVAGDSLGLRIRHSLLTDFTNNVADETTLTLALPLSPERNVWAAAGVSRLTDVSFTEKTPTVGVPVELLFYPVRGLELMLHGNINDDSSFVGLAISGAIGRQRPR